MEYHFISICGTPIWNHQTIYTTHTYPDFTTCFHYTILKWVPCFVLWLVAPFWTYALTSNVHQKFKLKVSLLSILKTVKINKITLTIFSHILIIY